MPNIYRVGELVFQFNEMRQLEPASVNKKQTSESYPQQKHAEIKRKRKGRKSTILTGPLGVEEEAEIQKKTLLGS